VERLPERACAKASRNAASREAGVEKGIELTRSGMHRGAAQVTGEVEVKAPGTVGKKRATRSAARCWATGHWGGGVVHPRGATLP